MDTLITLYPMLSTLWVVWFLVVFLVMLALVLRPSRRRHYEAMGQLPLRDDQPPHLPN